MIVPFKCAKARHVRGTRVEVGQTLYAIRKDGYYFIWCYSDRAFAEKIDQKVYPGHHPRVDRETDIAANWRTSIWNLTPTDRKTF